jgi:hypothetical protein
VLPDRSVLQEGLQRCKLIMNRSAHASSCMHMSLVAQGVQLSGMSTYDALHFLVISKLGFIDSSAGGLCLAALVTLFTLSRSKPVDNCQQQHCVRSLHSKTKKNLACNAG